MKYLGVDWGLNKIGLAVSDGDIASSYRVLNVQKNSLYEAVAKIAAIVKSREVEYVILGKPEGKMGEIVEKVTVALKKEGLNVILVDETLSTQNAKKMMAEMGFKRKARQNDDAVSAAIILQSFLDEKT